jgi:hypothetical protein
MLLSPRYDGILFATFFNIGVDKGSDGLEAAPSFYPYGEELTVN